MHKLINIQNVLVRAVLHQTDSLFFFFFFIESFRMRYGGQKNISAECVVQPEPGTKNHVFVIFLWVERREMVHAVCAMLPWVNIYFMDPKNVVKFAWLSNVKFSLLFFFFRIHWTRCSGYRVFKGEWIKCTQRCESIFIINTMVAEDQNIHSCPWILIRKCGWMRWSLLADGEHRNFECTIQIYHAYRISIR